MCADLATKDLERALAARNPADMKESAEAALRWIGLAVEAQPHSARRRVDLADALAAAGDARGAVEAYEQALAQDDRLRLDPLMQFSARERTRVETSLARARASAAKPSP
jgi:lipopolysaccharide biosynthesis regulator YciM